MVFLAKFITFEGGEGVGKTTQSRMLHEYLLSKGIKNIVTREPGGTKVSEYIRKFLSDNEVLNKTELLLIMASRNEHLEQVIKRALAQGVWVICDRFIDSTICYQSLTDLSEEFIVDMHNLFFDNLWPDRTFFLNLEPDSALKRILVRNKLDRYDSMNISTHKDIYDKYCQLIKKYPDRIISINAKEDIEEIHRKIIVYINRLLYKE